MRSLGIDISGSDIAWIGIDGQISGGRLFFVSPNKLRFPTSGHSDFDNLMHLKQSVEVTIASLSLDVVGVVKAGHDCSAIRVKCEFVIEMACYTAGIECKLIAPQSIAAAEKRKIALATGTSFEQAFNGGQPVNPKYLARAAASAWCAMA